MAQNRAAEELAALTRSAQGAQDHAANIAASDRERGMEGGQIAPGDMSGDNKASFAFPEALATAVGAGWLLGPVGGLALGIAQGIIGKEERQNALDQFAAEQEAVNGVQDTLNGQFDQLRTNATNKNDVEQLNALQQQQDAAFKMMLSGSPKLQQAGSELLASVQAEVNEYTDMQEAQRIEADALDAQLKRELDQEQYTRYSSLQDDFTAESQGYEDITQATNTALEALERGTPADLWAATVLVNKALDPTSVVRQEESAAIGALGSLWDKAGTIIERLANGQSILPEQRRELSALVGTIQNGATQLQLAREARYRSQLSDAEVPTRYWDNFKLVDSVPAYEQGPITAEQDEDILNAARQSVMDAPETISTAFDKAMEAVTRRTDAANKVLHDAVPGRQAPTRGRRTN